MVQSNMRLEGKVAIITGGAQGIGRACALGMACEGCKVVIADIDIINSERLIEELKGNGWEAMAVRTDVSKEMQTLQMAEKAIERFGRIDILLNNAGLVSRGAISRVPFFEIDIAEWNRVLAVNLTGAFLCARAVFPFMRSQGGGKIINITSVQFFHPVVTYAHYIASKGGIVALTRALASELGQFNINVNCLAPGKIISEPALNDSEIQSVGKAAARRAIKRIETPKDLVGSLIFLASADSDFITGQTLVVDGGSFMH